MFGAIAVFCCGVCDKCVRIRTNVATFDTAPELQELTLNEIFNGCAVFEGFCPIVCRCHP